MSASIAIAPSMSQFFHEVVADALKARHLDTSAEAAGYLVGVPILGSARPRGARPHDEPEPTRPVDPNGQAIQPRYETVRAGATVRVSGTRS